MISEIVLLRSWPDPSAEFRALHQLWVPMTISFQRSRYLLAPVRQGRLRYGRCQAPTGCK